MGQEVGFMHDAFNLWAFLVIFGCKKYLIFMAAKQTTAGGRRGRPPGPPKVPLHIRVAPELLRDLDFLSTVLDGSPSPNMLAHQAVRDYVQRKLEDPAIRSAYDARFTGQLKVLKGGVRP